MSWSLSVTGANAEEAKAKLCEQNTETGGEMPENVKQAIGALLDTLPAANVPGYAAVQISTYGYARPDDAQGTSNVNVSISQVSDAIG